MFMSDLPACMQIHMHYAMSWGPEGTGSIGVDSQDERTQTLVIFKSNHCFWSRRNSVAHIISIFLCTEIQVNPFNKANFPSNPVDTATWRSYGVFKDLGTHINIHRSKAQQTINLRIGFDPYPQIWRNTANNSYWRITAKQPIIIADSLKSKDQTENLSKDLWAP